MESLFLVPSEQFKELLNKVDQISSILTNQNDKTADVISNQKFIEMMNISKRTAQSWRDEGKISFSQMGGKIYYRYEDIQKFLDENHKKSFKPG